MQVHKVNTFIFTLLNFIYKIQQGKRQSQIMFMEEKNVYRTVNSQCGHENHEQHRY